jgi:hypothetical protein
MLVYTCLTLALSTSTEGGESQAMARGSMGGATGDLATSAAPWRRLALTERACPSEGLKREGALASMARAVEREKDC